LNERASHFGTEGAKQVSTALVPVAARVHEASADRGSGHARADFLAQLIATLARAPQTRTRRRAEPQEAIAAYGARSRLPMPSGHALSRSL
jgi:hypothetical protein